MSRRVTGFFSMGKQSDMQEPMRIGLKSGLWEFLDEKGQKNWISKTYEEGESPMD